MSRKIWAGLDVGTETTAICVIDDLGTVLQEGTCPTALEDVHRELRWMKRRRSARVGLEAGPGICLARGLRSLGYPVDLYEARKLSKFLRVRRNKTDAGDASGIAEAGRIGASLVSKVHLKSLECQLLQSRLTIRRHLIRQRVISLNLLYRQLELYGGKIFGCVKGRLLRAKVEAEIGKVFGRSSNPLIRELRHLVGHVEQLAAHQKFIDQELARVASDNELCRRFMEIHGVGPICALTFYAAIGEPTRFGKTSGVGPYLGLAPRLHQSGLSMRLGRISKMGNKAARTLLVGAGVSLMKAKKADGRLGSWAAGVEQRRGRARARVAVARKLATVMLAMWKSGEHYVPAATDGPEERS
jgi:transposase